MDDDSYRRIDIHSSALRVLMALPFPCHAISLTGDRLAAGAPDGLKGIALVTAVGIRQSLLSPPLSELGLCAGHVGTC